MNNQTPSTDDTLKEILTADDTTAPQSQGHRPPAAAAPPRRNSMFTKAHLHRRPVPVWLSRVVRIIAAIITVLLLLRFADRVATF